jgi:phage-related protein
MANVLSLAMKLTASAAGMKSGISESEKLLKGLSRTAESAGKGFEAFRDSTGSIPEVMQGLATDLQLLSSAFREGLIGADEFKAQFNEITSEAREMTQAFKEGAAITEKVKTDEERRAETLSRLQKLLEVGAISQETFARAAAEADGSNQRAAEAESKRARALQDAARIIQANLTPQERYDKELLELKAHLDEGRLSQEQYNRAVAAAKSSFDKASSSADALDGIADGADEAGLKFNELTGVFAALPGPIGSVAGRISGLASAGEGLGKLFSGGISSAISNVGSQLAGLANPATLAVAGFAAASAAVTALARGLVDLENRVEKSSIEAKKLGTSFQFMQELELAANRTGESIDTLRVGFTALLRNIDAAKNGNKQTAKAFADLGITMEDLQSKTPEEIFKLVGQSLNTIEDPALRTAAALKTVGENGGRLQPAFRALAEAQEDLVRFNAQLDEFQVANILDMGNAFDDLGTAVQGLGQSILAPFAGMFEAVSAGLAQAFATISRNAGVLLDAFSPLFTAVGIITESFLTMLSVIGNVIGAVFEPFGSYGASVNEVLMAMGDAMRAVGKFINDTITYFRELIASFFDFRGAGEAVSEVFSAIGDVFGRIIAIVQQVAENIGSFIGEIVSRFVAFAESHPIVTQAVEAIGAAFSAVVDIIVGFGSAFLKAADQVLKWIEWFVGVEDDIPAVEVEFNANADGLNEASLAATQFYDEITEASKAAAELGQEGFDAAVRYQAVLEEIAQLQAEGELTQEEAARAAKQATEEYERQNEVIRQKQEAEKKAAEEAQKAAEKQMQADRGRIERLREQQRIEREFGGSQERFQANEDVIAIDRERARIEKEIADARKAGDTSQVNTLTAELAQLDQLRQQQQDIASGAKGVRDAITEITAAANEAIIDAAAIGPEAASAIADFQTVIEDLEEDLQIGLISEEEFRKASERARKIFDEEVKHAEQVANLREKLATAQADIDRERLESLSEKRQEPLKVADVRTQEGAAALIATAVGREDPAIAEYRKQLTKLDEIKREIARQGGSTVVEIV